MTLGSRVTFQVIEPLFMEKGEKKHVSKEPNNRPPGAIIINTFKIIK